jgi:CRISPR-associated endonuclease Cas1
LATASQTVQQPHFSRKSPISKGGVFTIRGFGVRVRMQSGHLEVEDGVGMDRRKTRLARVGHGLKRLVCISDDGFVTLSALKWLSDIGASFLFLNQVGKIHFSTGPTAPSDARLRRAQALALGNGKGLEISRALINAKLQGQERVMRERLNDEIVCGEIAGLRKKLESASSIGEIRWLESRAAIAYFGALRDVRVLWPRKDLRRIPQHWQTIGSRHSPLSGGPRLAITPVHALLNYCFALLESETRRALVSVGLDPGLGLGLHTDNPDRDSLVFDVLEAVRPQLEDWVLSWVMHEPLRRSDFFETGTGNCRLISHLCIKLSETSPTWGKLVAPWAEYVARALWDETPRRSTSRSLPTPLTQQHRREAKGAPSFPTVEAPKIDRLCPGCGKKLGRRDRRLCIECSLPVIRKNFDEGRRTAQRPEFLVKRSATQRIHKQAIRNWNPLELPGWLTRDMFVNKVQPALKHVAKSKVRSLLCVSEPYSADIQSGKRVPHPRHWQALAKLAGVSIPL